MTRRFAPFAAVLLAGLSLAVAAEPPADQPPRSGSFYATPGIRAMQADDFANPGMLWVAQGAAFWSARAGAAGKACADCHGALSGMAGIAFPRRDPADPQRLVNLDLQIEQCRIRRMDAPAFGLESKELVALAAAIRHQARGRPAQVVEDRDAIARGEREFRRKRGQFDLACAQCHAERPGKQLRDETLSQGQSNGFPAYRVRWQEVGSLHRRFQACNNAVGAEPSAIGSQDYIALEWFLAWRGRALPVETPAVRQ